MTPQEEHFTQALKRDRELTPWGRFSTVQSLRSARQCVLRSFPWRSSCFYQCHLPHVILEEKAMNGISTHCITFGAPLLANESVRLFCKSEMFDHQIIHFVGHKDIVPGILSLGHSINEHKKMLHQFSMKQQVVLLVQIYVSNVLPTGGLFEVFFPNNQNM